MPRQRGRVTPHASGKGLRLIGEVDDIASPTRRPPGPLASPPPQPSAWGDERERIYASSAERRRGLDAAYGRATPRRSRRVRASDLLRAGWHACPGLLTVWILRTHCATRPLRRWRAVDIALALVPFTVACWLLEWARLVGPLRHRDRVPLLTALLRADERTRVHGTAWYLLGVAFALCAFPADVAACAICQLAFADPAASLAGRSLGDVAWTGGTYRRGRKSVAGSVVCAVVSACVTWFLYCGVYVVMPEVNEELAWPHFLGGAALAAATAVEDEENAGRMCALCVASGVATAVVEALAGDGSWGGAEGAEGSRGSIGKGKGGGGYAGDATSSSFAAMVRRGFTNDNLAIPALGGAALYAARLALLGS
ncbi:predicted protein [Micromonas commoda]|uniref:Phosphatidate cytidylyltransferase n=1 Tax=Micromonas commoda (strain RCC299 / NOUM17 / CCMP2709) TaxID=296587 RepID=C1EBP9_MICCC|nr:predicted protein [Micromonas commoda]ACO65759.1 predicted protein [Micromonas commoda]|eukprot:XP_002504501.1 predicted protein [Micromonas commoda]